MPIEVKICGLSTPGTVAAAVDGGARFVGFVFYPPSPRCVSPERAAELGADVPASVTRVGLVVDADDDTLDGIVSVARPGMLQLHGMESVDRVREIKARFGVAVMKVVRMAGPGDVAAARAFALTRARPGDPPDAWRRYLPAVRQQALHLARARRIAILRKGKPVDPHAPFKGVVRLARVESR